MKTRQIKVAFYLFFILLSSCATTENSPKNRSETALDLQKEPSFSEANFKEFSPAFNIPIVVNREVEWFIRYFQTTHRRHFVRWLARSKKYIPLMQKILKENNLPTDLVYMAMIESGFSTKARSHKQAVGPWQFIPGTGKRYGLRTDWWIDERKDPIKSTIAAAQYLKDLYDMFGSWFLAAAGYNAGENKIKRAINRHKTEDFWELATYRYLRRETKQYIPKLIAALLIAKSPEKYGFKDIEYEEPLEFDTVEIDSPIDLRTAAKVLEIDYESLKDLNPELRRWNTPPNISSYQLKIPFGKKGEFLVRYKEIKPKNKMLFHAHKIRPGDTLYKIAKLYKTQIDPILEMNNIRFPRRIRPGDHLIIPIKAKGVELEQKPPPKTPAENQET
jgi:membrane-bound lytic murein transglycosylase D